MFTPQSEKILPSLFVCAIGLVFFIFCLFMSCYTKEAQDGAKKNQLPKVVAIYPSSDTLPENLLRFYVQFSHSMKAVNNLENIKLLNEKGKEIKGAIFNNVYELWDGEQKQLTLILDPSRVKTGLVAHETLGRALEPGKRFQLVIEEAEDIHGNKIEQPYVKDIYVTKEDKEIPDIKNWEIITPEFKSQYPLKIISSQVLDRLSLYHKIRLLDEMGEVVYGKIEISNQEKTWCFYPENNWKKGIYTLQINSRLEDPSGNNLNGLFDHELGSLKSEKEGETMELHVEIR